MQPVHSSTFTYLNRVHMLQQTYEELCLLGCYAVWLLLNTDVSEEHSTSIITVKRIHELGTTLAVTSS
jgi:hypothetical protein